MPTLFTRWRHFDSLAFRKFEFCPVKVQQYVKKYKTEQRRRSKNMKKKTEVVTKNIDPRLVFHNTTKQVACNVINYRNVQVLRCTTDHPNPIATESVFQSSLLIKIKPDECSNSVCATFISTVDTF